MPTPLFGRLQSLLRGWAAAPPGEATEAPLPAAADGPAGSEGRPRPANQSAALLAELRELFAFTLETAIATQLVESPALVETRTSPRISAAPARPENCGIFSPA